MHFSSINPRYFEINLLCDEYKMYKFENNNSSIIPIRFPRSVLHPRDTTTTAKEGGIADMFMRICDPVFITLLVMFMIPGRKGKHVQHYTRTLQPLMVDT